MRINSTNSIALTFFIATLFLPISFALSISKESVGSFAKQVDTILVGARGPLSTNDAEVFIDAWKSTFNALFHADQLYVDTVMISHEKVHMDETSNTNPPSYIRVPTPPVTIGGNWSTYIVLQLDLQGHCQDCENSNQNALLSALQAQATIFKTDLAMLTRKFEMDLCSTLRTHPVTSFSTVSECIVDFHSRAKLNAIERRSSVPVETIEIDEQVKTIILGMAHEVSDEEANLINDMWMQSYNEIHKTWAQVESVTIIGEEMNDGSEDFLGSSFSSSSISFWLSLRGKCAGCKRGDTFADDVTPLRPKFSLQLPGLSQGASDPAILHRQFERTLCHNLRTNSVPAFDNIEDCIIEFHPSLSGPVQERSQIIEVVLLGSEEVMNDEETAFMDECIKIAYNSLHDAVDVEIQQVGLVSQESHKPTKTDFEAKNLESEWMFKYTSFWFEVSGQCHKCNPDDSENSFLPLLFLLTSKSLVNPIILHREFERSLCDELRAGAYDYFHDIDDCIVSFSPAPQALLVKTA